MARTFAGGAATDNITSALQPNYTTTSWQFWMNVTAYDATSRRLFDTDDVNNLGQLMNMANAGTLVYQYNRSTTAGVWTVAQPSAGSWHHLVITYDGSSVNNNPVIYVDGASVTVTTSTTPVGTLGGTNASVIIGNRTDNARCFNGSIAEVAVWNSILTGANVTSLYNSGNGALATSVAGANLQGYWQLCGNSPEPDTSVNNNNPGTVTGTTVIGSPVALCPTSSIPVFFGQHFNPFALPFEGTLLQRL